MPIRVRARRSATGSERDVSCIVTCWAAEHCRPAQCAVLNAAGSLPIVETFRNNRDILLIGGTVQNSSDNLPTGGTLLYGPLLYEIF